MRRALLAVLLTAPIAARAIVTGDGGVPPLPAGLDLGGVAQLANGCSSSLLDGGRWLLGAAHCAGAVGSTATFSGGATATLAEIVYAPAWQPQQQVALNDLVLMRLAEPVADVRGYVLAGTVPLGTSFVLAGYGLGGDGTTGEGADAGTLRIAYNTYELVLPDAPGATYGGSVLAYDFDDGTPAASRFGSLGHGAGEGMVAGLDSGGPSFVYENGAWRLAGVHAGRVQGLGTGFGAIGVDTLVASHGAWIVSVSAVPEFAPFWSFGIALPVVWRLARGRPSGPVRARAPRAERDAQRGINAKRTYWAWLQRTMTRSRASRRASAGTVKRQ